MGTARENRSLTVAARMEQTSLRVWAKVSLWRPVWRTALDIIFPRFCLLCRAGVNDDHPHFCTRCREVLRYERARPACPRCAHSTGPFGIRDGRCSACKNGKRHLEHLVRVGP